jgi:hypothetical protein
MRTFSFCTTITLLFAAILVVFASTADAKRQKQYNAKQVVNFKVDGDLTEWTRAEVIKFDQIKDVGAGIPKPDDFTGSARVGWNAKDPNRIYFAVEITDDKLQDIHPFNDLWWEDDSMEFMFDFDNEQVNGVLVQWTLAANGKELSAAAAKENTEWVVIKNGNDYIYEAALDPTKPRGPNPGNPTKGNNFKAKAGLLIGLALHANDCENGAREHQIGWTSGGAWDALSYGDLIFDEEILAVEASGKLAVMWGNLKLR